MKGTHESLSPPDIGQFGNPRYSDRHGRAERGTIPPPVGKWEGFFGLKHINHAYQEREGGIADALRLREHFADKEPICVTLGDNLIENNILAAC